MRKRSTAVIALAVVSASVGGPALASVAGRTPHYGGGPTPTIPFTSTLDSTTSATPTPTLRVCIAAGRRTIAGALEVRAATIHEHLFTASNGMPQCNFVAARAHGGGPPGKVVVTVNVDNGPQAGWRLMRKVVEASQTFGPVPKGWKPPVLESGLGANAAWFPNLDQMMANNLNHTYLLTVGAIWHHATRAELIALERTTITTYRRMVRLPA
jgi:hypothetical protein